MTVKMAERSVETILKYHFSNRELLEEALLAAGASVSSKNLQGDAKGNKRLALLGDSVLQEAVLEPWYNSKESTEEGHNRVKCLCGNKRLKEIAQRSGISDCITKNPSQNGQVPQETAASTVEALVGAVYIDCGEDISRVHQVLEAIDFFKE
ncbi:ribonuclease III domain-containing protein [Bipolaris maydis]|nr:ribonuclease III domain-containing protein [Bipolaris maydis]KAJ6273428.1 ribonuclease III domain-containing protein [Bipolaris maydis]